ncbi:MAG: 2-oxo acid dehydrogenase subunit E2 [Verrucomicrobiota bacterium]|jgi:pyruvate dehydrogenase E2 component (dihydrolipoamide acetyltransferase)
MDLKLPPLGEGVDSGSVVSLLVKEGDQIAKGQGIIELETGKAVAPVPSSAGGKVTKILVSVGDKISVGQTILSLEGDAAAPAKPAAAKPAATRSTRPVPLPVEEGAAEEPLAEEDVDPNAPAPAASPTLRRMARELGIDLRRIHGSEAGGRIVMDDLRGYIRRLQYLAAQPRTTAAGAPAKPPPEQIDFSKWGPVAKRPMTSLRKVIAQRMSDSWNAVARVTQFDEADITALEALRQKHAPAYEKKGARLTLTAFALKIVAEALKKHPVFNASLDEIAGEVVYKEYYHIGLAVDTDQGLIVPVLRDVDKKDLLTLSRELGELAVKTRERKVSMDQLQGGSFTLSNQGGIGGSHFTPIINRPELAILGLGRGALKPVVRDGKIEPRLMLPLALSYDHRVIDGGAAVRCMLDLVRGFEQFDEQLIA